MNQKFINILISHTTCSILRIYMNIVYSFFGKDGYLRHFSQHLIIALAVYYILITTAQISYGTRNLIIFLFFTYIIDLDGLVGFYRKRNQTLEAANVIMAFKNLQIKKFILAVTKEHKKLTKLYVHNIVGFLITILLTFYFFTTNTAIGILASSAVLAHLTFDIVDDIYQLGHINNWLWPLNETG